MDLANNIEDDRDGRRWLSLRAKRRRHLVKCQSGGEDSDKIERGVVGEVEAWLALLNLGKMRFHNGHIYV